MQWRNEPGGYLREILTAKVYDVAVETPLEKAEKLSEALGNTVLLKREDLQVRGAGGAWVGEHRAYGLALLWSPTSLGSTVLSSGSLQVRTSGVALLWPFALDLLPEHGAA